MKNFFKKLFSRKWMISQQRKMTSQEINKYKEQDIFIHPDSYIGLNTTIDLGTNINGPAFIASNQDYPVTIGKYCAIAHNFRVRVRNHNPNYLNIQDKLQNRYKFPSLSLSKGPVTIGNNVWIADNVIVLSGVSIGDGSIIGAGSIVTKSIPPYHIAAGNPARIIRKRFSDKIIAQLMILDWWNWSHTKIERNRHLFEIDLNENEDINLIDMVVDL